MTDIHTTAHIPDEAVRAAMSKVLLTKPEALDALHAAQTTEAGK